jgi:WD40 repeat protein
VRRWESPQLEERFRDAECGGALEFSPDGSTLAVAGDRVVFLWDCRTRKMRQVLEGPKGKLDAVAFAPDGRSLAAGSDLGELIVWELPSGRVRWRATLFEPLKKKEFLEVVRDYAVGVLAFSPDGRTLATGLKPSRFWMDNPGGGLERLEREMTGALKLWDPVTGQRRATLDWPTGYITGLGFAADGTSLMATGVDRSGRPAKGLVKLWRGGGR